MDESSAVRESVPPTPPRWKAIQSLDLVHQLNERCIELLCERCDRRRFWHDGLTLSPAER